MISAAHQIYATKQGDTWDSISFDKYGSELYADVIFKANIAHDDVIIFSAGIELEIPDIEIQAANNVAPWLR